MNYKLTPAEKGSTHMTPSESTYTLDYLKGVSDLCLSEEIKADQYRNLTKYYRLHAKHDHGFEQALAYDIHCPRCGHLLKYVGGARNTHDLGLFRCPICEKR